MASESGMDNQRFPYPCFFSAARLAKGAIFLLKFLLGVLETSGRAAASVGHLCDLARVSISKKGFLSGLELLASQIIDDEGTAPPGCWSFACDVWLKVKMLWLGFCATIDTR